MAQQEWTQRHHPRATGSWRTTARQQLLLCHCGNAAIAPRALPVASLCATISLTLLPNLTFLPKTTIKVPAHHLNSTWSWEMLAENHRPIRGSLRRSALEHLQLLHGGEKRGTAGLCTLPPPQFPARRAPSARLPLPTAAPGSGIAFGQRGYK